jgi:prepilin-type N-terminal cleavage/methylation domain-containing protein
MGHPSIPTRRAATRIVRRGTTLIELIMVLAVLGIVIAVTMPKISKGVGQSRVDRASRIAMNDLRLAAQLAARHRRPVRWIKGATNGNMGWRITNAAAPETVYVNRAMSGAGNDFSVSNVSTNSRDTVLFYPTGLTNGAMTLTITGANSYSRTVTMTRAGFVH